MALKYTITHNGNTWNSTTDVSSINLSNGSTTSSITSAGTRTLNCAGKYMPNNLVIGAKTLNCAGKIMSGNVVITAQDAFDPTAHSRVGGRIFYDNGSNGCTYTFYTSSGTVITDTSISGLANAYYYDKTGTSSTDRWYVYDTTYGLVKSKTWGKYGTRTDINNNSIGSGKTNTAAMMSLSPDGTMWTWLRDTINANNTGGCNDWFIASQAEQDELKNSGLINWYSSNFIWTSVEYNKARAYAWEYNFSRWYNYPKTDSTCAFAARSF